MYRSPNISAMRRDRRENAPPDCCDMRGLLSFTILWLLTKRDMYGQELADELERRRGTRPNPGTLYPALMELEKSGLVRSRREGRRKVYHLTEEGREGAIRACEYFCRAYGDIFKEFASE
ncbi:PadR family transcriptional regulator [Candidatus Bathyarchaeota archaeon]|nr:MAG: PadR family transcriptional regulator [Candidatus Bathyarchaeota archaeon]